MYAYLVAGLVGATLAHKGRPKSKHKRRESLGCRSGLVYTVDEFRDAGLIVVHSPIRNSFAVFERLPQGGFTFLKGKGHPEEIRAIVLDFSPGTLEEPKI